MDGRTGPKTYEAIARYVLKTRVGQQRGSGSRFTGQRPRNSDFPRPSSSQSLSQRQRHHHSCLRAMLRDARVDG